eukprot:412222_1
MSTLLQKLFQLLQRVINKVKTPCDIPRLMKFIAFASVIIIFWYRKIRHRKHDNIIMLPEWTSRTGHAPFFIKYFDNDFNENIYYLIKRASFPSICAMNAFNLFGILILDPDLVKFIWQTEFEKFKKGKRVQTDLEELLGDGIFTSDAPEWKFHRKSASRLFSMRNLKDYMFSMTVFHTKQVINKINSNDAFLDDIDIYNMLARFTLDAFTAISFGKSTDSVSIFPEKHAFAEAFDNCIYLFAERHMTPSFIWKPIRLLPERLTFGNEYKIKKNIKVIDEFANQVLSARQTAIATISDESGDKYNDIISLFIKQDKNLTNKQLKHIAMNMIIAGRDTTRLLLSWFFYEMCLEHNSDIKSKIYTEIDNWIVNNNGKTEIDYQKVNDSLLYLESTLLETLRLHPAVPFLIRFAMEDVELPNGNIIRKGDEVVIPTYAFARNPNVFQNPLKFDPLRFFNKGKDPINVYDVYRYPFFNVNPRLCLGRKLALMESKIFVFYFFQQYNFEMADKNQQIKIKTGMVLNMVDGLRLKLIKKSEP